MGIRYRYVIEERAVEAFFSATADEQELLLAYFRLLAGQPHAEGSFWRVDDAGRKNFVDTCGPFTIAHWADHAACEVRIVEFIRS